MWLLSSEPTQLGWCCQGAPSAVRFHQPIGSWARSFFPASSLLPQLLSNRQWSTSHYQPVSIFTLTILQTTTLNGNSPWLTSLPILSPKRQEKIYNIQPATKQLHFSNICIMWQILSAILPPSPSVWLPSVISILSKPPKIVSCFYPAFCSMSLM